MPNTNTWDQVDILYNAYRDAELNRKYYGHRLSNYQWWNQAMEYAIAIGSAGSILSWQIWDTEAGKAALGSVLGVSAVLAVAKPILGLAKQIERFSKLFAGYTAVFQDLKELVDQIQVERTVAAGTEKKISAAKKRMADLDMLDDPVPVESLRRSCFAEVNREIPLDRLWYPSETETAIPA